MIYKTMQTPPVSAWPILSKLFPCICRTKHTHDRYFCLLPQSFVIIGSWDVCRNRAAAPRPHCRQARLAAAHPCHIPWNVQIISKGRHGAGSPPAVPSYPLWNVLLVAADAHTQHTDKSSSSVCPQSIFSLLFYHSSQRLPYAQKVGGLLIVFYVVQGLAESEGWYKWNISFVSG